MWNGSSSTAHTDRTDPKLKIIDLAFPRVGANYAATTCSIDCPYNTLMELAYLCLWAACSWYGGLCRNALRAIYWIIGFQPVRLSIHFEYLQQLIYCSEITAFMWLHQGSTVTLDDEVGQYITEVLTSPKGAYKLMQEGWRFIRGLFCLHPVPLAVVQ